MLVAVVLSACTEPSGVSGVDWYQEPGNTSSSPVPRPRGRDHALAPRPPRPSTPTGTPPEQVPPVEPGEQPPPPLVAAVTADVDEGEFPLVVSFDASASQLGGGAVHYAWDFGDGGWSDEGAPAHTYIGEGTFVAEVTLGDDVTGAISTAQVTIEVDRPDCPHEDAPVQWGVVDDDGLNSVSGMASSKIDPEALWVHEDRGGRSKVVALDAAGETIGEYDLEHNLTDFEDMEAAVDPQTGVSWLFLGDIGDNNDVRDSVSVWVVEEPDPHDDGDLDPLELELEYPDGAHDAETLIVDPLTLDLYIVTKVFSGDAEVYVKRAPHDDPGPFELERLGSPWTLDMTATSGDASPDGSRVVVRDYSRTARLFFRDGYLPFEDAFDHDGCNITVADEEQGEAVAFTSDGAGIVTTSEGATQPIYFIEL